MQQGCRRPGCRPGAAAGAAAPAAGAIRVLAEALTRARSQPSPLSHVVALTRMPRKATSPARTPKVSSTRGVFWDEKEETKLTKLKSSGKQLTWAEIAEKLERLLHCEL